MGDKQPQGMATKGMPEGPEIPDKSQVDTSQKAGGQPGLQRDMQAQPVSDKLPTQHGDQDVLTLEAYKGVGKFRGKVAIVTGGDSGIGRSVALLLAKESAKAVAIVHLPKEQPDADEAKKLIEAEGVEAMLIPADLSEGEEACRCIVEQVVQKHGQINVLINNAAIQYIVPSITETTPEIVEDTFKTNIFPLFYLTKHAVPHMPRGSAIVNSTSVTAYQGSKSLLEYSATKGAIVAFTRSLAGQLAPQGIRVNGVAAGPIWTPLNPASRDQENLEGWLSKEPPLGRIGQPIEAATSYLFLAGQESSYMTGQVLHPNGGYVVNG
ncbi:NAD(P)-dependent oxidoreductase [Micractinium conductrix]|uniref:NAD(P)-dependent oxidoreductase n=1 Tax=Micractinium conductrix TaxID=554055 RepID=A0A2P6VPH0_9CHLO|nr:NAD(P)-dependent oxidoreductase [Micractinium conductrix]|eukprot:PSC75991.1 NAD(P)-dependent oxidoreductase [Micractinium conductrix]